MNGSVLAAVVAALVAAVPSPNVNARLAPIAHSVQSALVQRYVRDLQNAEYDDAYALLNARARAYYRDARNLRSIYTADSYRIERFTLIGMRAGGPAGSVFFVRERARFRDYAHDADLVVTATVPVGVVPEGGGWCIKDPGHPWRAFAVQARSIAHGVRVTVKKMSFFTHRIEAVVSFANIGDRFVTVLPYGKSILRDAGGTPYRIIETHDWALTDKTLFEGLRLAPDAQYTATLSFTCEPLGNATRAFALRVAPILVDGADTPFAIDVNDITASNAPEPAAK